MHVTATTDAAGICHVTVENDGIRYQLHGVPTVNINVTHELPEIVADPTCAMVVTSDGHIRFGLRVDPKTVTAASIILDPPHIPPDFDEETA